MATPQLNLVVESVTDNLDAIGGLLQLHWEEVAKNKHLMVLKPDYEKYKTLDKMGKLLGIFAYYDESIVGYSVNIIDTHLHYKELVVCNNDVLFLDQSFRDTPLGLRLKKKTEEEAKARGAHMITWHAKEGSSLDLILQRQKYSVQDIIYSKEL